jgi:tRNA threonylcarbamoyladenosine biosynthesis protein TsaB
LIILGLETATPQVGCAFGDEEGPVASFHLSQGRRHAETLAPAIDFLCRESGIGLDSVGVIAVDVGPGLFTGLRVGVATAKAMASALGVPVAGLSSLDLLAYPHRRSAGLIASVVDARRGEVFWALYRAVPGGVQRQSDYAVSRPHTLASELHALHQDVLAVGDGARRYLAELEGLDHVVVAESSAAYPSAAVLVELALPRAQRGDTSAAEDVVPLYLRQADVRINWAERDRSPAIAGAARMQEVG